MKFFVIIILLFLSNKICVFANTLIDNVKEQKIIFYLHGKIIEDKGKDAISDEYGKYEYDKILSLFQQYDFLVKSEIREYNTNANDYADRICCQINELLNNGIKGEDITIVGASKGAVIAMLISTKMKNQDLNFVLIANCNEWVEENFEIDLHGNVLSIYETSDYYGQSCNSIFSQSTGLKKVKEIKLNLGIGHGIIFKPLEDWIIPSIEWAKSNKNEP